MARHDRLAAQPFGLGRPHIVGLDGIQHTLACPARNATNRRQPIGDNWQDQVAWAAPATGGQPAQLGRKDVDQDKAHHKAGDGADPHREEGYTVIKPRIGASCRHDANHKPNRDGQGGGQATDQGTVRHQIANDSRYRFFWRRKGRAKI